MTEQSWQESEWFRQWLKLAKKNYHGKTECPKFGYLDTKEGEALHRLEIGWSGQNPDMRREH